MKVRSLFLLSLFAVVLSTSALHAKRFTYEQIHNMPRSVEKDYYIWRFLSQTTTTADEAKKIIYEASSINTKLNEAYMRRTGQKVKLPKLKAVGGGEANKNWRKRLKAHKSFKHGIALMQQRKPEQAAMYFNDAYRNYDKQYDIDKSLFWLYLSTKDDNYIKILRESCNANMYTLIAADTINARYPKTITESIWKNRISGFDIQDPIQWAKVKEKMYSGVDLDDLADDHKSQETIGIYTFLKAKACNYTESYYPMPYRDAMKHMTPGTYLCHSETGEPFCACFGLTFLCTWDDAVHAVSH